MTESRAAGGVDLEKIRITGRDWDMSDWPTEEITVEGIVMPLEGCGANEDRAAVIDVYGRDLHIVGVRRHGSRVELVVDTEFRSALATLAASQSVSLSASAAGATATRWRGPERRRPLMCSVGDRGPLTMASGSGARRQERNPLV